MIPAVVLDTSVLIKWIRQGEVLSEQALVFRDVYLKGEIWIMEPSLATYELANVLRYKGDLSTKQVQEAIQSIIDMGFEWIMPSKDLIDLAVEMACKYDTTVYDSTFAALGVLRSALFITADKRLADKLTEIPVVEFLGDIKGIKNGELVKTTNSPK